MLNKHRTHRDPAIFFESAFKPVSVKSIKNELTENNVSVLSLVMFYKNRKIMIYKVIGVVIYTIIDN